MIISKKPIVLVPGFGGSKLVKTCVAGVCKLPTKNEFINLNIFKKEWEERFKLRYDPSSGFSIDDDIDTYDFGGINGIRNLCEDCDKIDGLLQYFGHNYQINDVYNYRYFDTLIERLERDGYEPTIDLFGAPYDFRKIAFEPYLDQYAQRLKALVEDAFDFSKKKVIIVAHSIGSLVTYVLLCEYFDDRWKNKYIDSFVSIAAPFGGCSTALKTIISGLPKLSFLKDKYADIMARSSGLALALPNHLGYEAHHSLLLNKNTNALYTIHNYSEVLPESTRFIYDKHIRTLLPSFTKNTGIKTVLVTTSTKATEVSYDYSGIDISAYKEPQKIHYGAGDSLIPVKSLLYHKRNGLWFPNYKHYEIPRTEHTKILHTKRMFQIIKSLTDT